MTNLDEQFLVLPDNLANHLMLTVIALGVGVLVSVPLAVWLVRREKLRYPVLATAGVIQTIPSLALLALMVPLLDNLNELANRVASDVPLEQIPRDQRIEILAAFGFWPAVIALSLYSILPILRNTVTGILGVDPAMTEAARGVGMTERQVLRRVQLPLAAPVIIAGIRTSTVWVVGIATLATPVGQRCLGNYIFAGLQTRNWTAVMFGVVAAALLAIVLDALIGGLQKAAEKRSKWLAWTCGLTLIVIGVIGLIGPALLAAEDDLEIGSKTFTEQYILSRVIAGEMRDADINARPVESLGSTIVFDALRNGDIDVYVDYTGTIWANYMNREGAPSAKQVLDEVTRWLKEEHDITLLGPLGFENAYALAMRREQAERLGVTSIADLAAHSADLKIGGDYEFFDRPEWRAIRDGYNLRFDDQVSYDSNLMYAAIAGGQVDVISAFSSDGRIAAYDLVVLTDPKQVIPPYDAVLLIGPAAAGSAAVHDALGPRPDDMSAEEYRRQAEQYLRDTLQPLINAINVETMQRANELVDSKDQTPHQAARWLRQKLKEKNE